MCNRPRQLVPLKLTMAASKQPQNRWKMQENRRVRPAKTRSHWAYEWRILIKQSPNERCCCADCLLAKLAPGYTMLFWVMVYWDDSRKVDAKGTSFGVWFTMYRGCSHLISCTKTCDAYNKTKPNSFLLAVQRKNCVTVLTFCFYITTLFMWLGLGHFGIFTQTFYL